MFLQAGAQWEVFSYECVLWRYQDCDIMTFLILISWHQWQCVTSDQWAWSALETLVCDTNKYCLHWDITTDHESLVAIILKTIYYTSPSIIICRHQTLDSILWGIYNNVSANDHGSSHSSIIGLGSVAPVCNDYLCLVYNSVIILIELGKLCYNWKESISRIMCQHSVFVYILILTLLLPPVSHLLLSYQYIITTLLKGFRYKQYWTIFFLVQTKQK